MAEASSPRDYVPLWCKSNYSFLEGASHPEELIQRAHEFGLSRLALTDRDGVYGLVRAYVSARELGFSVISGSQITVDDGSTLVILVKNQTGYRNMCRLLTTGQQRSIKGSSQVSWDEVCNHSSGLIALWTGLRGAGEPTANAHTIDLAQARQLSLLKAAFAENLYLLLTRHQQPAQARHEHTLRHWHRVYELPLVANTEVLYHDRQRKALQDVLTCIRHKTSLDRAGRLLRANAEHVLLPASAACRLFADHPQALAQTVAIAEQCEFHLGLLRYRYPEQNLPLGHSPLSRLHELCTTALVQRYGDGPFAEKAAKQLEHEVQLIRDLDYAGYFLTMYEIVEYCRDKQILCQGRGSAANSIVCYLLRITAVDPIESSLLFERFLSRERAEPPDIDLDIEHETREDVIQHVYDRFGREYAAMVANVIRYRPRSALREVGKALDLSESTIDRAARLVDAYDRVTAQALHEAGLDLQTPRHQLLLHLANELLDFPRHLSIHPGGFLLGHEPVCDLVPIENASMPARTVIQWDKDDVDALGLFKVDLLALGSLTHIQRTFRLIQQQHQVTFELATLPRDDPATYDQICRGDTVGVFQIESRAQMSMLPRLRPRTFYDLVIEISIVRPGPISGGMVHPYLRRRRGQEAIDYPHPKLVPVLEKTLGIPLFQEQVMRLAMVVADYTAGEADQLRRDMAAWRRPGRLEAHQNRLINRMIANGIERSFAERVFQQICGFGEYGFPESHAASFAILAYATSWLKCHYPNEFTCALLNSQPMGFYSPATIVHDAKRHGVCFLPVDVEHSDWDCSLERDETRCQTAIRMGLREIKGVSSSQVNALITARTKAPFANLDDFVRRTALDRRALANLASAGALASLTADRRHALWQIHGAQPRRGDALALSFDEAEPVLTPLSPHEQVLWDYIYSAHSTAEHPFISLRAELNRRHCLSAHDLETVGDGMRSRCAGMVICRQRPPTAKGVLFMTLEDESGLINAVVWPPIFNRYRTVLRTCDALLLHGRVQNQDRVTNFIVEHVEALELQEATRAVPSRNFR